jgi:calpain, invertebrate
VKTILNKNLLNYIKGEYEWNGAWSDDSSEWNECSESIKTKVGLLKEKDGEFWMSFGDFLANFEYITICHLSMNSFIDDIIEKSHLENVTWRKLQSDFERSWKCSTIYSEWIVGKNAGGLYTSGFTSSEYWTNPQFLIKIENADLYDSQNKANVIISLMQKDYRIKRLTAGDYYFLGEFIQFSLMKIKDTSKINQAKENGVKFSGEQLVFIGDTGKHTNKREITKRFRIEPGYYIIIPSSHYANKKFEFLFRVFTEQLIETRYFNF